MLSDSLGLMERLVLLVCFLKLQVVRDGKVTFADIN